LLNDKVSVNYHEILEDRYIEDVVRRIRLLFYIEDLIEFRINEEELQNLEIRIDGLLKEDIGRITVYGEGIAGNFEYRDIYEDVEIIFKRGRGIGYTISEIYRVLGFRIAKNAASRLSKYLSHDREYLTAILLNGMTIMLEGFERSVIIPVLESTIFIAHTHPKTRQTVFSRKDLIATLDIISKRGLGACVIAMGATLCILREKALTFEEYEKFELLINDYGMATKDVLERAEFKSLYILYSMLDLYSYSFG